MCCFASGSTAGKKTFSLYVNALMIGYMLARRCPQAPALSHLLCVGHPILFGFLFFHFDYSVPLLCPCKISGEGKL